MITFELGLIIALLSYLVYLIRGFDLSINIVEQTEETYMFRAPDMSEDDEESDEDTEDDE